jgi:hypothetical protein
MAEQKELTLAQNGREAPVMFSRKEDPQMRLISITILCWFYEAVAGITAIAAVVTVAVPAYG